VSKKKVFLAVVDSLPGVPAKLSKTRVVAMTKDKNGRISFDLKAKPPKRQKSPSSESIRRARLSAGLTQKEAGALCFSALRSWQDWEYGKRRMHPAIWHAFNSAIKKEM